MNIIISDTYELEILEAIALKNKMSIEQYATNIVRGFIQTQIKGIYSRYVNEQPIGTIQSKIGALTIDSTIKKEV